MNFTGTGSNWRDDVNVLALEQPGGWLYEVKIERHPVYDTCPYRSAQKFPSQNDALAAGKQKAAELSRVA